MDRKTKLKDDDEEMQPRVQPDADDLTDIDKTIFQILQPLLQMIHPQQRHAWDGSQPEEAQSSQGTEISGAAGGPMPPPQGHRIVSDSALELGTDDGEYCGIRLK